MNQSPYICGAHSIHPPYIQHWIEPVYPQLLLSLTFVQDRNSKIYNIPLTSTNTFAITNIFLMFSLVKIYVLLK